MNIKKILAITGIRSEYDILYPVIKALSKDRRFELKLVVSGAHLSDWHGYTLEKIQSDNFEIADMIDSLYMTNRKTQRVKGIGSLVTALSQTAERETPDVLLVVGDREESIAAALVGNYMDILVAHIGGGDPVYGNADDPIRFAVSKLAHIHFTTAKQYTRNLKDIGEEDFRVFWSGNTGLDNIRNTREIVIKELRKSLDFNIEVGKYVVLINHPLSSEKEEAGSQMQTILESLAIFTGKHNFKVVASYPNTDPGSYDILSVIKEFEYLPHFKFFKSIPRYEFVNLMRNASALIGNSSMGLLETPYYKLPTVNIGNRQKGRLNAGNVNFVGYEINLIVKALEKACFNDDYRKKISKLVNPYGDGHASQKIVDILASIDLNNKKWYVKHKLC
jgi:GDP/UDP-N,N'-diacetylbacillosamine 2-epimerase (hydrolysing)